MKKFTSKFFVFTIFLFLIIGCNENSVTDLEEGTLESLSKAGNDNPKIDPEDANYFDENGNLCIRNYGSQNDGTPLELWMGVGNRNAGTKVGEIQFNNDCVTIDMTKGEGLYDLTAIHMEFVNQYADFPTNRPGNPQIGKFSFNFDSVDKLNAIRKEASVYEICNTGLAQKYLGAIHIEAVPGKVSGPTSVKGFSNYLPDGLVTMSVENYSTPPASPSYFKLNIGSDGGVLTGKYEAWCIDNDHDIDRQKDYSALIFSSYETLPSKFVGPGKIDFPENFDKVNYLLNSFSAGENIILRNSDCSEFDGSKEVITSGDIQRAIWYFLDDDITNPSTLGPWSAERTNAIICDVDANGDGFEHTCGDLILFIAIPVDSNGDVTSQPVIAPVKFGCEPGVGSGTAWADGKYGIQFLGNSWATFFGIGCN